MNRLQFMHKDLSMNPNELMTATGVKPSALRLQIYHYLDTHRTHPTVYEMYSDLAESYPTLSKTTVYNTVKLLAETDIIKAIAIEGFRTRYDANTAFHAHFLCRKCGMVYDIFDVKEPDFPENGFVAETTDVYYSGSCKNCQNKIKN